MQCIVDRFEGDYAVIEYCNQVLNLPKVFLPAETHEGDVLDIVVLLDDNETGKMKAEIKKLMEEVWEK
jgi:phage terminase large subunit-like protein